MAIQHWIHSTGVTVLQVSLAILRSEGNHFHTSFSYPPHFRASNPWNLTGSRIGRSHPSRDESCVFLPTFGDGSDHREAAPGPELPLRVLFALAENITPRCESCPAASTVTF